MSSKIVSLSENHTYFEEFESIVFSGIELFELPDRYHIDGLELFLKSEFHATIISLKRTARLIDDANKDQIQKRILSLFRAYIDEHNMSELTVGQEYRLVKDRGMTTVVVMVQLEGLKQFFEILQKEFNTAIPVQPAHITLYVEPGDPGIPINSPEKLSETSKIIDSDLGVKLRT